LAKYSEAGARGLDGGLRILRQAALDKSGGGREARQIADANGASRLDNDHATLGALAHWRAPNKKPRLLSRQGFDRSFLP
jgi:hypothetical protein